MIIAKLKSLVIQNGALVKSFGRYIIAGIIATLIHIGCFALAREHGWSVTQANGGAFLIANIGSYLMANFFVFQTKKLSLNQYKKFLLLASVGFVFTISVSEWITEMQWHPWLAVAIVVVCIPIINFNLLRLLVFKK